MSKEALTLALEALEVEDLACRYEKEPTPEYIAKAITAIKEALAQQDVQDEIDRGAKTLRETYLAQPEQCRKEQRGNGEYVCNCNSGECPELAQPEQEPVGEVSKAEFGDYPVICWRKGYVAKIGDKFYTTPPQRTWVGLTDEEIAKIILDEFGSVSPPHGFSQDSMVEAFKLGAAHGIKEKNT